jgi:hypothetical protein
MKQVFISRLNDISISRRPSNCSDIASCGHAFVLVPCPGDYDHACASPRQGPHAASLSNSTVTDAKLASRQIVRLLHQHIKLPTTK